MRPDGYRMSSKMIWFLSISVALCVFGCGPASPEKCTDYNRYGLSCGSSTDCGDYLCLESKGEPCLAGACARMCTKSCQSSTDCPAESAGVGVQSECKSGICVAVKCEKAAG